MRLMCTLKPAFKGYIRLHFPKNSLGKEKMALLEQGLTVISVSDPHTLYADPDPGF
jgi:hypothetical protein